MGLFKSIMSVISTDGKTGTPFNLDKNHTVYYKGNGVTAIDAAHVAGFYKGYGYFTETNQADVQIVSKKQGDPVEIGYIIGGKSVSPETEDYFRAAKESLQTHFPGRSISLHLLNTNLEKLKAL